MIAMLASLAQSNRVLGDEKGESDDNNWMPLPLPFPLLTVFVADAIATSVSTSVATSVAMLELASRIKTTASLLGMMIVDE